MPSDIKSRVQQIEETKLIDVETIGELIYLLKIHKREAFDYDKPRYDN